MSQSVTRRTFLGTAAAAGAGVLLPGATSAARRTRRRRKVDVAIVGAGLAGSSPAAPAAGAGEDEDLRGRGPRTASAAARYNHTVQRGVIAEVGRRYSRPDPGPRARSGQGDGGRHVSHLQRRQQRPLRGRPALDVPGGPRSLRQPRLPAGDPERHRRGWRPMASGRCRSRRPGRHPRRQSGTP